MITNTPSRPDTVMGRALATRALVLADALVVAGASTQDGALIDLTRPKLAQVPDHVRAAAAAALDRGETHYTSRPGVPDLRAAIARRSSAEGFSATPDAVVVTNGGAEALYIALQSLLTPGDQLLAAEPVLPNVREMVRFIGAELVGIPTHGETRFLPSARDLPDGEAAALLLTSPSPITGAAIEPSALRELVAAALDRGIAVILDRSLATALYDPTLARFTEPDLGAQVFTIGSFSTGHGLGGWRVGWFTAPSDQVAKLRELKQAMSICTTAVSQFAALAALEGPDEWLDVRRSTFASRRDAAVAGLTAAGFTPVKPDAYPTLLFDVRNAATDSRQAADRLRERAGVVVEPGSAFGDVTAGFARIDLGVDEAVLVAGIERIAELRKEGNTR